MNPVAEDILMHYGMPRRSGRYPWGSGEDPHQHGSKDFLSRVDELKKEGWTETPENIKNAFGITTTQYRIEKAICKDERRALQIDKIKSLKEDRLTNSEIGRIMGINESTVRSLLNEKSEARMREAKETAAFIKSQVDKNGGQMVDVGVGVERELNISQEKLKQALYLLEREGYPVYKGGIPQVTNPGQQTNQKVICPPGTQHKEIYQFDKIHPLNEDKYISRDDGKTFEKKFNYPESMDSKRLQIRYAEDGGIEKDGIIELRRNVPDLSLGESRYSQVRILVDGTHYIKGMAVYSDDMPPGVDVVFNTNKKKNIEKMDVLKKIKDDPDNPFGSLIKDADQGGQYWYDDPKTGKKKLGLINKRADEGDWDDWADALPSQFLSKQSLSMAKKQLGIAKADREAEFDEIKSLTNPTLKKHYLDKFAEECDAAAVHLKAAALPGQKYHVIIPVNSLKDNEIYAPKYENGTQLALIRYPHGGTFEIPICIVNNKHKKAIDLLGKDIEDAVGINAKVAERLSGADFDGDTVMCIPTHDRGGKVKIASRDQLKELIGFDPKIEYGPESYAGRNVKIMKNTQTEMGVISNLITDMTLAGASEDKLARAVRHSMVVIDAEKHKLDYKRSEQVNNIAALKKEYQPKYDDDGNLIRTGGASTIISRASGEHTTIATKGSPRINTKFNKDGTLNKDYNPNRPEGSLIYKEDPKAWYTYEKVNKRTGEVTTVTDYRKKKSTNMAETDDAYTLVSKARHPMELVYADYANNMKDLANRARLESFNTGKIAYDKNAKATYNKEVSDLEEKLRIAELNRTKEREANRRANVEVTTKQANSAEKLKISEVKKLGQQALTKYRTEVGSVSRRERNFDITDREWEAIQAGAISENKLKRILNNADVDKLRERAMPKTTKTLTSAQISRIKAMSASYTLEQIAEKMGKSPSTISKYLKGAK